MTRITYDKNNDFISYLILNNPRYLRSIKKNVKVGKER